MHGKGRRRRRESVAAAGAGQMNWLLPAELGLPWLASAPFAAAEGYDLE